MAATPLAVHGATARTRPQLVPYDWPLLGLYAGFGVWWVTGFGQLVWPLFAIPMAVRLVTARRVEIPRVMELWLLFLVWVVASAVMLPAGGFPFAFVWRLANYAAMTITFLYVFNASQIPARRVVGALVVFWAVVVAGGWLGVLWPTGEFTSLAERILPGWLTSDRFMHDLIHPGFAQVHEFLGYPVGRPKAPFVYTNDWGSNIGLLTPLVVWWVTTEAPGRRRRIVVGLLVASVVPMIVSLNRGLWLSLGAGLLYAGIRFAVRGQTRVLRVVLASIAVVATLLAVTPMRGLVEDRLATGHSNEGREFLYEQAIDDASSSPLLGRGGPYQAETARIVPAVGTQGHLWLVLVSQGFAGAAVFLAFMVVAFRRLRRGPPLTVWCQVVLLVGLVQLPFYDMIPASLHVMLLALAVGLRAQAATVETSR